MACICFAPQGGDLTSAILQAATEVPSLSRGPFCDNVGRALCWHHKPIGVRVSPLLELTSV